MPFPFFKDIRKSLFDDNDGTFGKGNFGTGSGKVSVKSKASNGHKFEAEFNTMGADSDGKATGGKSSFKFTYPKLGKGKYHGDLAIKGTINRTKDEGSRTSYKVQYKKLAFGDDNVADFTYDLGKKNFDVEVKSQQKKFGVYGKLTLGLKGGIADAFKAPKGRIEVVGGSGDNTFGAGVDFEVGADKDACLAGPLKHPELISVFRPADGLEVIVQTNTKGLLAKKPEFHFGITTDVDANNTMHLGYKMTTDGSDSCGGFGGTRKIGDDSLHYRFCQTGQVQGSYTTSLADHVEGVVTFSKDMNDMSLDGAEFGYELNFS